MPQALCRSFQTRIPKPIDTQPITKSGRSRVTWRPPPRWAGAGLSHVHVAREQAALICAEIRQRASMLTEREQPEDLPRLRECAALLHERAQFEPFGRATKLARSRSRLHSWKKKIGNRSLRG